MSIPLRVLLLEDSTADAELIVQELHRARFAPNWQRVETEVEFLACLDSAFDIILAEYRLPECTALTVLQHIKQHNKDIPVIVITGTLSDEEAAECMKQGANYCLLKDRLASLGPAIGHALENKTMREAHRRAGLHQTVGYAISQVLMESITFDETIQRILHLLCETLQWEWSAIWQVDRQTNALRCIAIWHTPSIQVPEFEAITHQISFSPGVGLPGRVWASGQPAYIPNVVQDANFPRASVAAKEGIRGGFAFPLVFGGSISGVMEFFSRTVRYPDDIVLDLSTTIGSQIGHLIERKRSEDTLARLAAIVESSNDVIISKTLDGTVLSWNAAAERTYGYSAYEMIGRSIFTLVPPKKQDELHEILERMARGERIRHLETVRVRKDGQQIEVSLTISPIKDVSGKIVGSSTIAHDITERKSLEDQLRESQKMDAIGRLAGGVAHDFNNMLTVITGYAQTILDSLSPDNPLIQNVLEIKKAAERSAALTRQLLAFSRKQVLQTKVLNLNGTITNLESMLRRVIGEDIELRTVLSPRLGCVKADPGQVEQVILNLVVNARDAMPEGGKLTIEAANVDLDQAYIQRHLTVRPGRYVMLAISDTGCGMDAETQEHIFEPFFTTKELGRGTGLGLSTVYGIVKQSSGYIWVYSEPSKGTTFKIYLPRTEEVAEPVEPSSVSDSPIRGSETVLIVEDEEGVRTLLRSVLQQSGYVVLEATHSKEAFFRAGRHNGEIHLMITDVVMPGMNGRELAERMKSSYPKMKVLFISGYTDSTIVHHGVLDSGRHFLGKPFTTDALTHKVREVLDTGH